jgi:hypothetical protein
MKDEGGRMRDAAYGSRRRILHLGVAVGAAALVAACGPATGLPPTPPALTLVTREEWGAVPPNLEAFGEHGQFDPVTNPTGWLVYDRPLAEVLTTLIVHHSASALDGPRDIQKLHMERRGYADVAYHYLIGYQGQLYVGRDVHVRGAHTAGFNTGTVGACLLGNFQNQQPAAAQLDTRRILAANLAATVGIGYLASHQDFLPGETLCPGEHLAPLLPELAAGVGLAYGTQGYGPPAWSTPS